MGKIILVIVVLCCIGIYFVPNEKRVLVKITLADGKSDTLEMRKDRYEDRSFEGQEGYRYKKVVKEEIISEYEF